MVQTEVVRDSHNSGLIEEAVIALEKSVPEANPEVVRLLVKPQTAKTYHQRDKTFGSHEEDEIISVGNST
jgi:hypothetical protein